jgi:hypothetical protein
MSLRPLFRGLDCLPAASASEGKRALHNLKTSFIKCTITTNIATF